MSYLYNLPLKWNRTRLRVDFFCCCSFYHIHLNINIILYECVLCLVCIRQIVAIEHLLQLFAHIMSNALKNRIIPMRFFLQKFDRKKLDRAQFLQVWGKNDRKWRMELNFGFRSQLNIGWCNIFGVLLETIYWSVPYISLL